MQASKYIFIALTVTLSLISFSAFGEDELNRAEWGENGDYDNTSFAGSKSVNGPSRSQASEKNPCAAISNPDVKDSCEVMDEEDKKLYFGDQSA